MSKRVYKIFILSVLLIVMFNIKSFAVVGKDINKQITNWTSGGYTGWTDDLKKQEYDKILSYLKNDFQYTGDTVTNEMKMKTTISIEKKSRKFFSYLPWNDAAYEYTIRVRNRK
mgnify:FL=1